MDLPEKCCTICLVVDPFLCLLLLFGEFIQPGLEQKVLVFGLLYCHVGVVHLIDAAYLPWLRSKNCASRVDSDLTHLVLEV